MRFRMLAAPFPSGGGVREGAFKQLYDVEDAARELTSELRRELRQERSKPHLDDFGKWLGDQS